MDYFDRILGQDDELNIEKKREDSLGLQQEKSSDEIISASWDFDPDKAPAGQPSKTLGARLSMLFTVIDIFVLIPAAFYICLRSGDRRLYIGSLIIMVLAMLPFFVNFERRKPKARELVTLAVLIAAAVVSRVAFMWLPAFKPMAGFIAITAICFGPQAGFMSGSLSMLLSNIIFGQGPWTPWQMFCYGMVGFIAGLLAKPGIMSEKHSIRSGIITFFLVTILSSLVLDSSTLFFMFSKISKSSILTIYIAGLPINVLNGLASGLAVLLLSKPISIIINRIKLKYGVQSN